MKLRSLIAFVCMLFLAVAVSGSSCSKSNVPSTPTLEAGVAGVDGTCTFLEGVTENQTVISVCATVEEIAQIVAGLVPLLAKPGDTEEPCTAIPGTPYCATPRDLGHAIQMLLARRRALLLLDGGGGGGRR